jgi:adenosyl cobinamide kinase/adenosyl cobinamide phosphate guanylyltransferase
MPKAKPTVKPAAPAKKTVSVKTIARATKAEPAKKVAKVAKVAKGSRPDWEAIARDYRTGTFTDQELGSKYGRSRQAITKMAKVKSWTKDLSDAVRKATNAALIAEAAKDRVAEQVAAGSAATLDVVLISAEVNKQIILGHRTDLKSTRDVASDLLQELAQAALLAEDKEALAMLLAGEGASPQAESHARSLVNKAMSVNTRISSVKALADTFAKLQESERKAFNIDAAKPESTNDAMADFLADLASRGSRLPTGAKT